MYATNSLFMLAVLCSAGQAKATVSCSEYTHHAQYGTLDAIMPPSSTPEEKRNNIPEQCGEGGLIFNPSGMQTYYYKSECFYDLSKQTLKEKYCDSVLERKPLFSDGSYYSPAHCHAEIQQMKALKASSKADPERITRIESMQASVRDGALWVEIRLSNAHADGIYGISLLSHYPAANAGSNKVAKVNHDVMTADRLKPQGAGIHQDSRFAKIDPLSDYALSLSGNQKTLSFKIPEASFAHTFKALQQGRQVTLDAELHFLQSKAGIADPDSLYKYASKKTINLQP